MFYLIIVDFPFWFFLSSKGKPFFAIYQEIEKVCEAKTKLKQKAAVATRSYNSHISRRLRLLSLGLEYDVWHNHLLHRDASVLECITIVADVAIGVVVVDQEVVVVGENITRSEV